MRLNAPKKIVWIWSLIFALIGIVGYVLCMFVTIPVLPQLVFWFLALGWLLVWLGNILKGF
jgi:hypothetical protein